MNQMVRLIVSGLGNLGIRFVGILSEKGEEIRARVFDA